MVLHHPSEVTPDSEARHRCERYLDRLPLTAARRDALLRQATSGGVTPAAAFEALHLALASSKCDDDEATRCSIDARLALAWPTSPESAALTPGGDNGSQPPLSSMPPIARSSMVPRDWPPRFSLLPWPTGGGRGGAARDWDRTDIQHRPWRAAAIRRRLLHLLLVLAQTGAGTWLALAVLPYHGRHVLEMAVLVLFAILLFWISSGFWTAVTGFVMLLRGRDRYGPSAAAVENMPLDTTERIAVIMPICNEDVGQVFAGLRATYESLSATGEGSHFDFFVLSDSNSADMRMAELEAWARACSELGASGRIFYRWRKYRVKRKSGNIADFCRRWGSQYRYMVVLDADSVMSGSCLVSLARMMQACPDAGIIQTVPSASGRETLYARIQQFSTRIYGPLFAAGLRYRQLGDSYYWGHNAIIRVAPFMRHCALGNLPGKRGQAGEILSHDFVEAALMRRAGWNVWIVPDLPGSYEEMPPSLIEELKRDHRWCKGNLINARMAFAEGVRSAHRAVFMTGVMAYVSAPLWFAYLLLSTALLAIFTLVPPIYFVEPHQLYPIWPQWHLEWAVGLFTGTSALLFFPRVLGLVETWIRQGAQGFGGAARLTASALLELLTSMLLAPIRMMFHTRFVLTSMLGGALHWKSPAREDAETGWGEAFRRHGPQTLLGLAWAAGAYALNPSFLWWLLPVVGALILSVPLSVYSSRVGLGRLARAARLFLTPEESQPPWELRRVQELRRSAPRAYGFVDTVVDPICNALACASGSTRKGHATARRAELVQKALRAGPDALNTREKMLLQSDPVALSRLHADVWTLASAHVAWRNACGI